MGSLRKRRTRPALSKKIIIDEYSEDELFWKSKKPRRIFESINMLVEDILSYENSARYTLSSDILQIEKKIASLPRYRGIRILTDRDRASIRRLTIVSYIRLRFSYVPHTVIHYFFPKSNDKQTWIFAISDMLRVALLLKKYGAKKYGKIPMDSEGHHGIRPSSLLNLYHSDGDIKTLVGVLQYLKTVTLEGESIHFYNSCLVFLFKYPLYNRPVKRIRQLFHNIVIISRLFYDKYRYLPSFEFDFYIVENIHKVKNIGRMALQLAYLKKIKNEIPSSSKKIFISREDWFDSYPEVKNLIGLMHHWQHAGFSNITVLQMYSHLEKDKFLKIISFFGTWCHQLTFEHPLAKRIRRKIKEYCLYNTSDELDNLYIKFKPLKKYSNILYKYIKSIDGYNWDNFYKAIKEGLVPSTIDLSSSHHLLEWLNSKGFTSEARIIRDIKYKKLFQILDRKAQSDMQHTIDNNKSEYERGIVLGQLFNDVLIALLAYPDDTIFVIHGRDCEVVYQLAKRLYPALSQRMRYILSSRPLTTKGIAISSNYYKYLESIIPKHIPAVHIDTGFAGSIPMWFAKKGWNVSKIKLISANTPEMALLGKESMNSSLRNIVLCDIEHAPQRLEEPHAESWGNWWFSPDCAGFWARLYGILDGINMIQMAGQQLR